jgi:hypothetical protein
MGFLNNGVPTLAAENILLECIDKAPIVEQPKDESFEVIWKMFPRDDEFRHFSKTRMIRWNKAETNKWYNEARLKYSHEQLQQALERELAYRNTSVKENLFKYMKGSVNWFKEEAFLNFLEMEDIKYDNTYGKDIAD